jgi:hypothetical protein
MIWMAPGTDNYGVESMPRRSQTAGLTNIPIVVEACTNLVNPVWTPLQTFTLTNGKFRFSDPQWTNYLGRFYRIRAP